MKTKALNNRIRKSTKNAIILVSVILLIFSLSSFFSNIMRPNTSTKTKEIYKYTDKFHYDYKINLINNKYMTSEEVEDKTLAYVTDLIDNIDLDINYEHLASLKTGLKCIYSVQGKMQVVYNKNGEEQKIWEKNETILKETSKEIVTDDLKINEKIVLDLKDKNKLLSDFKQQLGMTIEAKYTVLLNIKVTTKVDEKEVEDIFVPFINIDLAEKTTKISGENNTEKTEFISREYKVSQRQNVVIAIDVVIIAVAVVLLRYALKSKPINKIRNDYKYELNRILKICQDKIVEVSTKPSDEEQEVIFVKDFGEIVKISEELFKPILYYNVKENEEAWFYVMSGKTSYRYILRK